MNAWFESEFRQQALQPGLTQYIAIVDWLKQNFPKYEFKTLSSGIRNIVGLGKWTDFPYLSSQHLDTNYFENKNTFTGAVSGLKINQFKTVDSQARLLLACFEADKTGGLVVKYLLENKKTPNGVHGLRILFSQHLVKRKSYQGPLAKSRGSMTETF